MPGLKLYKHVYGFGWFAPMTPRGASVVASLLLTVCAEVGIRDQSGQERGRPPEVSRCCRCRLSAEPAIVRQLQGCATPGLFGVYSAASAKCSGRGESIVCRQVCLSCARMLTSSPSEFRETIKSRWMEADLHKQKDTLNTLRPTPALGAGAAWPEVTPAECWESTTTTICFEYCFRIGSFFFLPYAPLRWNAPLDLTWEWNYDAAWYVTLEYK